MTIQELKRVTRRCGPVLAAGLLLASCHTYFLWDHNAFQTGKVMNAGECRASVRTHEKVPTQGVVGLGLGRNWEIGGYCGDEPDFGWCGGLRVARSLYASPHLFSSAMLQTELAFRNKYGFELNLARITAGVAGSYYPAKWFGIYAPLRLSAVYSPEDWFRYPVRVWEDSIRERYHIEHRYRHFHGLKDIIVTPGIGLSFENKQGYVRLAYNRPLIAPNVSEDSVTWGFHAVPYMGIEAGVRLF